MKANCEVCGTEIDVIICCSGRECGCMGEPSEPPVCSDECYDEFMNKINSQKGQPKVLLIGMQPIGKAGIIAKHPELADIEIIEEIPKSIHDSTMSELRNTHIPIEILSTPYIDAQFGDNRSPRNIRRQKERDAKKFNKRYRK